MRTSCFIPFKSSVAGIELPQQFTFPFLYEPHPLALLASNELQEFIKRHQINWSHNFGIESGKSGEALGKMFGVLVVKDTEGNLGYLAAFSGMLNGTMDVDGFVPAAYDDSYDVAYFHQQFDAFNQLSQQIENLSTDPSYLELKAHVEEQQLTIDQLLQQQLEKHQTQRKKRKLHRNSIKSQLSSSEWDTLLEKDHQQQLNEKFLMREYEVYLIEKIAPLKKKFHTLEEEITILRELRKKLSLDHQDWIFSHYNLLNANGDFKNVVSIFEDLHLGIPPSSTGDCAAPKLLQHAFENNLTPIALAEFWWGKSSPSQVRKHGEFYPACRSKCEPILGHMLQGLEVAPNPMLINPATGKTLEIVYEDDAIAIIDKPHDFLSVPGKTLKDSVLTRMQQKYPDATGPLLVHRLDMATSGILVLAKTKKDHQKIQEQFINRTIHKKYVALLDGELRKQEGIIELPLRVDLDNRPAQLVCYEHGKPATTKYKVIEIKNDSTRIEFIPITGRTHQLRVHAAHVTGLNASIKGDDLYGTTSDRLHLHAAYIKFIHPRSGKSVSFNITPAF